VHDKEKAGFLPAFLFLSDVGSVEPEIATEQYTEID
jgi:hypothetical protein